MKLQLITLVTLVSSFAAAAQYEYDCGTHFNTKQTISIKSAKNNAHGYALEGTATLRVNDSKTGTSTTVDLRLEGQRDYIKLNGKQVSGLAMGEVSDVDIQVEVQRGAVNSTVSGFYIDYRKRITVNLSCKVLKSVD